MPLATSTARLPRTAVLASFAGGYGLAVTLAERSYGSLGVPSPFWLPDSVLLCALLLAPRSQWWVFALVIWPVRLLLGAVPGTPVWFLVVSVANDTAKGLAGAWLLERLLGRPVHLRTLREFMVFLAIAGAALPAASALAAAPARVLLGDPFWRAAYGWFLGDAVTQVVVTPTLLFWCRRPFVPRIGRLETACASGGLAGALLVGFVLEHSSYSLMFLYLPIPFLIWVAVRLGPFGAANALFLVALVAVFAAVEGRGLFTRAAADVAVLSIQLFLLVVATSMLSLAILVGEREVLQAREAVWSSRLIDAQDAERSRIATELHDDIGQQMAVLLMDINGLGKSGEMSEDGRQQLRTLRDAAMRMSSAITGLSHTLHPLIVELVGLEAAVRSLCEQFDERRELAVHVRCGGIPALLPRPVGLCSYRIVQEALHNVVTHSQAGSARVELFAGDGRVTISVSDSGVGFDVAQTLGSGGLGLLSMRERVRALGGTLAIESAPHMGTRILAVLPVELHADTAATVHDDRRARATDLSV